MKTLAVVAMGWLMLLDSAGGVEQECRPAPGQWVRVNSEWEPDATVARAAARARLDEAVRAWLQTEQPARADLATPQNLSQLLSRADVQRHERAEDRERPYGTLTRVHAEVWLTSAVANAWASELRTALQHRRVTVLAKVLAAVIGAGLLTGGVRSLDRWTRGYRRWPLGLACGVAVAFLTAVILWL